jgi:hypothetical protein
VSDMRPETDIRSLPEPWLRLAAKQGKGGATEGGKAYAAFQVYYMMPPCQRSLRRTALQLNRTETQMEGWSSLFSWVLRAELWDRHQARIVAAEFEQRNRERAARWADREQELLEQDYAASRALVVRGVQTLKLPLIEMTVQKPDGSGNQITIVKPVNRSQASAAAMIKVGHDLGLDCIKRGTPEPSGGSTGDEYEFVPLPDPKKEGGGE